jgi:LmbE family N-acetylglucosaminyl deacetylase
MTVDSPTPPDAWTDRQTILVILAHPDDPEFFCGGTLARWAQAGHEIHYCILTCGDKGSAGGHDPEQLTNIRHEEQSNAAAIIGVKSVRFLDHEDGYLLPTLELRREVVRVIRQIKPSILVTCDPSNLYVRENYLNHPDHRYTGQVVLDAVFPAAGNRYFFPELLNTEGLEPHTPREIWISLTSNPNVSLDVTDTWPIKVQALKEHKSQIGDPIKFEQRMESRKAERSTIEKAFYDEKFHVLKFG